MARDREEQTGQQPKMGTVANLPYDSGNRIDAC